MKRTFTKHAPATDRLAASAHGKHSAVNNLCMIKIVMTMRFLLLAGFLGSLVSCASSEFEVKTQPVRADDPKGIKLPRGVPRGVDTEGNVISLDSFFSSPEYERTAEKMVLQEANRVAEDMRFPDEVLPITESNVKGVRVSPFGFSYKFNTLGGVVVTSNYVYMIGRGSKFSGLTVADYDQTCLKLRKTLVSLADGHQRSLSVGNPMAGGCALGRDWVESGLSDSCCGFPALEWSFETRSDAEEGFRATLLRVVDYSAKGCARS